MYQQRQYSKTPILKYTTLRYHPKEGSSWQDTQVTQRQEWCTLGKSVTMLTPSLISQSLETPLNETTCP